MALTVTFTNFATGKHKRVVGDTWEAQDGPGRSWLETMVPRPIDDEGRLGWFAVGCNLERSDVEKIAEIVSNAAADWQDHDNVKWLAMIALEKSGFGHLVGSENND